MNLQNAPWAEFRITQNGVDEWVFELTVDGRKIECSTYSDRLIYAQFSKLVGDELLMMAKETLKLDGRD